MATNRNPEVDRYLAAFPPATQIVLQQMREIILKAAPGAEEVISYQMPAYRQHGILIYFAGYKAHVGLYPTSSGIAAFQKELSAYKGAKGSVQFPLDKPLPSALISRIVKFRIKEDQEKAKEKKQKLAAKKPVKKATKKGAKKGLKTTMHKAPARKARPSSKS